MPTYTIYILLPMESGGAWLFAIGLVVVFVVIWVLRWLGSFPATG